MTLTIGHGPFGHKSNGQFNFHREGPAHVLYLHEVDKRIRAELGPEMVVDSRRARMLHETGLLPVYYVPLEDVRQDALVPSDHTTHCPFKGDARYYHLRVGERTAENAVWTYPEPIESCPPIAGLAALYFDAMDAWFEEEEPIFGHPRDPFHRVDVRRSDRHVRVRIGGEIVAESREPRMLFETGLPPRFYLPPADIDETRLVPTDTTTRCPYKGVARYFSVRTADGLAEDAAFAYDEPLPEAQGIAGLRCFLGDGVEVEEV
jgi:uncharacterized protein (DUF427 family)